MIEIRIQPFKLLREAGTEERLRQFVAHYRPFATLMPCIGGFEQNVWDLRGKYFSASCGNLKANLRFTKLDTESQRTATKPFDEPFLEFAKAYVLHLMATNDWKSGSTLRCISISVLRRVEHGLHMAHPSVSPCITSLTEDVCEVINASIRTSDRDAHGKYKECLSLNQLVETLRELGLCARRFSWTGMALLPEQTSRKASPAGDKARADKLPSLEAMAAMAYCFDHAVDPREKWVSAINGLLSGQPARIGECWFLREDYWVAMEVQGQQRFGLKWWPQKKAKPLVKEFLANDTFVPVFKKCFDWLIEISAPARKMAKWYEANPDKLYLPKQLQHLREKKILAVAEAASIRGATEWGFLKSGGWAKNKGIMPVIDPVSGKKGFRFEDLERAVLSDLPQSFPWFHKAKNLKYSDMLLLLRESEFDSGKSTSPTMFRVPIVNLYYYHLDSMVDQYSLVEADGTPVRFRSHQFRHINETVAYRVGVERAWMNRQAGRARTSHEESYDDRTDAEKVAQASVVSVHRSVFGDLVTSAPNAPKTELEIMAEVELAKRTGYAHVTDKGCCINHFVDKPCGEFRDCLFCQNHICYKGVPLWDRNIRAAIAAEEESLAHAMEAAALGRYGVKEHIEELLLPRVVFCRQVKKVLDDPQILQGTQFGHSLKADPYDPVVNAMRHHVELGRKKGMDVTWVEHALERLQSISSTPSERPFLTEGE